MAASHVQLGHLFAPPYRALSANEQKFNIVVYETLVPIGGSNTRNFYSGCGYPYDFSVLRSLDVSPVGETELLSYDETQLPSFLGGFNEVVDILGLIKKVRAQGLELHVWFVEDARPGQPGEPSGTGRFVYLQVDGYRLTIKFKLCYSA